MIYPERYSRHRHGIAADHPYFMGRHIFLMNCGKSIKCCNKPPACHEHEQGFFPKTALCKEGHEQAGGRPQEKDNEHINLA